MHCCWAAEKINWEEVSLMYHFLPKSGNCRNSGKKKRFAIGTFGGPLIEQKTLDEWGTGSSIVG
jgi:hypothetical protein